MFAWMGSRHRGCASASPVCVTFSKRLCVESYQAPSKQVSKLEAKKHALPPPVPIPCLDGQSPPWARLRQPHVCDLYSKGCEWRASKQEQE